MNLARVCMVALFGALVIGCGSSTSNNVDSGSSNMNNSSTTSSIEQTNGGCPQNPTALTGSKNRGESCGTATDCKPSCCTCGNGKSNSWLGSECSNGACVDPCADTVGKADCSM